MPIFIFNDLGPGDGGTALCVGSHKKVAKLLWDAGSEGLEGGKVSHLAQRFLDDGEIVEVNGRAGDVMLMHPFTLHARSKNLGSRGLESVRFMCHPAVPLRERMQLDQSKDRLTPVRKPRCVHYLAMTSTLVPASGRGLHCKCSRAIVGRETKGSSASFHSAHTHL